MLRRIFSSRPRLQSKKNTECHKEFQMQTTSRSKTHTSNAIPTCIHTCTWIHTCMHTRIHGTLAVQQPPSQTKVAQNPTPVTLETPVCLLKKAENPAPPQELTARQPHLTLETTRAQQSTHTQKVPRPKQNKTKGND